MAALTLEKLSKSFGGKEVVQGISLEIPPGAIFGLLGPNGAGKSTTINMIAGVTRVGGGQVKIFGHDNQTDFITARRLTGVMHQEIVVDTFFTIDQALKIHAGYYGVPDDKAWREELIERLALGPHLKKSMNKLSGGMKRRFMVAKALIHQPKLLILDEPTAGVDVELRQGLWQFVREMNQKLGTTVLLTTHYLEEAEEMCESVAIMNHGRIIALDRTRDLLERLDDKRLILHLSTSLAALPGRLAAAGATLMPGGAALSLPIGREAKPVDLIQLACSEGLVVREIETRVPSLQDAFLKLTQGGSRGA